MATQKLYVVIPNLNGASRIGACLDSLKSQSLSHQVIVVDNGSVDNSVELLEKSWPEVLLVKHSKNLGFTGGVNAGIRAAIEQGADYVALLNNDAVADKSWLKVLAGFLDSNPKAGIATSKICDSKKTHLDSTGDFYTTWGLPFPRGRAEPYSDKYDNEAWVFGASGGASLYRVKMLNQIGLFDDNFFAYYEDIDLSFRAQLAGWKIGYVPQAVVYHEIGATSSKIKGFATYQTMKNLPQLLIKNVPGRLFWPIYFRFCLVYASIFFSAIARGQIWPALKGSLAAVVLTPKKLVQRHQIQSRRKASVDYINSILIHDLPPNARKLRRLRTVWSKP